MKSSSYIALIGIMFFVRYIAESCLKHDATAFIVGCFGLLVGIAYFICLAIEEK